MKFYYITEEKVKEHNLNWLRIPDHIHRKLIIRGTGTEETNSLFNWISHQNIDKIHLYIKYTKEKNLALKCLNLINNNAFWGCSRMGGGGGSKKARPPWKLSHIFCKEKTLHNYTLPKEDSKNIWIMWHQRFFIRNQQILLY